MFLDNEISVSYSQLNKLLFTWKPKLSCGFILVFWKLSLELLFGYFRTLFKDASGNLDKNARFSALYRQDSNKLSNDDMLKLLADFRKPEKMAKLPVILGNLDITIDNVSSDFPNKYKFSVITRQSSV